MKHLIFIFLTICLSINVFATTTPVKRSISNNEISYILNKEILNYLFDSAPQEQPQCRVCCSITAYDQNGNAKTFTACAGSFLTSCETAGTNACNRARLEGFITLFSDIK